MWKTYLKNHLQKYGANFVPSLAFDKSYDVDFFQNCFKEKYDILVFEKLQETNIKDNTNQLKQLIKQSLHNLKPGIVSAFNFYELLLDNELLVDVIIGIWARLEQYKNLMSLDVMNGPVSLMFKIDREDNKVEVNQFAVQSATRLCKHSFCSGIIADLQLMHDVNIEKEIRNILCDGIVEEILADITNIETVATQPDQYSQYNFNNTTNINGVDYKHSNTSLSEPFYLALYTITTKMVVDQQYLTPKMAVQLRYARGTRYEWYKGIKE